MTVIHASAVMVGRRGVIIRGKPGTGKSSLVLALLYADTKTTRLVADDRVIVSARDGIVSAAVPEAIAGMLEIRGVGIVKRPFVSPVVVSMVVDLCPAGECPRLPEPTDDHVEIEGVATPRIMMPIGLADAGLRIRAALDHRLS